jgi:hypothetical protein
VHSGDTLGHYRIVEPLGKGAMGEVFVAEDTRLNRRVALKILAVLSSILKDTPTPITDSNPNLPADLARIVRRCLGKSVLGYWPEGGTFVSLTPPSPEVVFGGAVSRDGRVAFSRGTQTNDVVISSSKQEAK